MKLIITAGLAVLGLFWAYLVFIATAFSWNAPSCYENGEAVALARALPAERLAALFSDMQELKELDGPFREYNSLMDQPDPGSQRAPMPIEFSDLNAKWIRPRSSEILLEGCLDAWVNLKFSGLADPAMSQSIVLGWGDHHEWRSEVLWSASIAR